MITAVIALTKNGSEMAVKIGSDIGADVYIKEEFMKGSTREKAFVFPIRNSLVQLVEDAFYRYEALIFIMACGIVVRAIAPYIKSKTTDPAVVVLDEKGQHVISLLSGHLGGANRLAADIAGITGGQPVITTSTDVNEVISFDLFAKKNGCVIENISNLKYISSELVNGGRVALLSSCRIEGDMPGNVVLIQGQDIKKTDSCTAAVILSNKADAWNGRGKTLLLRPRNLVLGIGCKKDTPVEKIRQAVEDFMEKNNRSFLSLKCLATIDLKKDEKGLLEFCKEKGLELKIILRQDIEAIEEGFTCSEFVKKNVGVASVAEPCAVLASENGRLICKKTAYNGITLALSEEDKEYCI